MPRFYLPPDAWQAPAWELAGDEAKHALKVMRLREGDTCTVFDGRGRAAETRITATRGSSGLLLEPVADLPQPPPIAEITLCQSIPKGGNMELIIQKAVELGVSRIIPLITKRTIVRLKPGEAEAKTEKWKRTVLEACKQCGQNTLPQIALPMDYRDFLAHADLPALKIHAALTDTAQPLRTVLEQARTAHIRQAAILVGPEGDFTPAENEAAAAHGFLPVTLGPIILRVETATFFAISAIRYALD